MGLAIFAKTAGVESNQGNGPPRAEAKASQPKFQLQSGTPIADQPFRRAESFRITGRIACEKTGEYTGWYVGIAKAPGAAQPGHVRWPLWRSVDVGMEISKNADGTSRVRDLDIDLTVFKPVIDILVIAKKTGDKKVSSEHISELDIKQQRCCGDKLILDFYPGRTVSRLTVNQRTGKIDLDYSGEGFLKRLFARHVIDGRVAKR